MDPEIPDDTSRPGVPIAHLNGPGLRYKKWPNPVTLWMAKHGSLSDYPITEAYDAMVTVEEKKWTELEPEMEAEIRRFSAIPVSHPARKICKQVMLASLKHMADSYDQWIKHHEGPCEEEVKRLRALSDVKGTEQRARAWIETIAGLKKLKEQIKGLIAKVESVVVEGKAEETDRAQAAREVSEKLKKK